MLNWRLHFILLFTLEFCACAEQPVTNAPSSKLVPSAQPQSAAVTMNRMSAADEQKLLMSLEMQKAVLRTQDLKEIKRLLKAGFKIDDPIGCGDYNCVDGAVAIHNPEFLKFFLESGAKPKGSAFFWAAYCKNENVSYQMMQLLLKAGADVNYKSQGLAALGSACYMDNTSVVELLVNQPGIDLNYIDIDHLTPLMHAAAKGNIKIVRLLLDKGADSGIVGSPNPNHPSNVIAKGRTAADYARNEEIRNLIVSYKSPPSIATASAPVKH